jgi:hypothetical protein
LRQLVEWQLTHNVAIRAKLDLAWGVKHYAHKKKPADIPVVQPPPPDDPDSKDQLSFIPIGQDYKKRRYWIVDGQYLPPVQFPKQLRIESSDSPRLYMSSNPWKVTATFATVASDKEEYLEVIEDLRSDHPILHEGGRRSKFDNFHVELIQKLVSRIDVIDAEVLVRIISNHSSLIELSALSGLERSENGLNERSC